MKRRQIILVSCLISISIFMIAYWQFFYTKNKPLSYNQIKNSKIEASSNDGYYQSTYKDTIITWQGKISNHYSQITGIKFCITDNDHTEINIDKSCDWFWALSDETKDADSISVNPNWNGLWVNYILNYYKVSFDKNSNFYNDTYKITGKVRGLDCGVDDKCIPDIEIINITK